ncbi:MULTISPECIES: alpha-hydroxy acid oxidase [unclassified Rhizobium]|jgi:isopentenyl diphosphate isomerase/L-lactate dehydrogenase-like FMN-dependent dehydrogenase|uniref:alpha-hydroxy acid oxidase n=1 Tax=unclassified Rhizobium TaxID=2613769 RepID=UPI0006474EA0|nr:MULTISPECIES: alpha-hydroxy acid oxidase [unclassified Rhizobium]OJY72098.1 MAG: alpha-hydroxy-acid oxidizing enzyme [Rhizobium sp. 60-20]RKD36051.1 isopentenyl diphosphate isomerase/L-lactate dehydrogenase-like FMN-dependent dehydrogenase [Rhizobium sp. WW_1]
MTIVNIDDLREAASRRLPKLFFDYIDGGSFAEETCRRNREDFSHLSLRQTILANSADPDLSTDFLGRQHALPFMLGPVGFLGLYSRNGEQKAARAAEAAGIPFALSTFSIASLSDVRETSNGILHFQLYVLDDREFAEELLHAARDANAEALHVTVDTAITAIRERDVRNGFRSLTRLTPRLLASLCRKPAWLFDIAQGGMPSVRAVRHRPDFGSGALEQAANLSRRIDKRLAWSDIARLRDRWKRKLVIKGILSPDDAEKAKAIGVDGVVISNHGGRQLDGAMSTISALPGIRAAVGPDFSLMLDGGIRRGSDIIKALGSGADGVMLGRAYTYGLAAAGQAGVAQAIDTLRREISIALTLMGCGSIEELKRRGPHFVTKMRTPE